MSTPDLQTPFAAYLGIKLTHVSTERVEAELAVRKELAVELDAGRIREADAISRFAARNSEILAEERRRSGRADSISAEATARLAHQRAALGAVCTEAEAAVSCF